MQLSDFALQHKEWLAKSDGGRQIDLSSVTLNAELIRQGVFQGAVFDRVVFEKLELVDCDFTAASFFDCDFTNCTFTRSSFHKSEFHNCKGTPVHFEHCEFTRSEWYRGDFRNTIFADCDFSWSYLQSIDLRCAQLLDVRIEGGVWDQIKVYHARFGSIDFGSTHPARLTETDVSENGDGTAEVTFARFREMFEV